MNNIPDNILQAAIDAAFNSNFVLQQGSLVCGDSQYPGDWKNEAPARLDLFKRALAAIAPHLAPASVGEYTDEELQKAWLKATHFKGVRPAMLHNFLSALPRRESPALAEVIARAEKAESLREFEYSIADEALARSDRTYAEICRAARSVGWINMVESGPITTFIRKIGGELAALRASQLGVLRPLAEAGPVPEGCVRVTGFDNGFGWYIGDLKGHDDTHFADIRLPAAQPAPAERPCGFNSALDVPSTTTPKPAEEVPLGPEDCPPGSVLSGNHAEGYCIPSRVDHIGVFLASKGHDAFIRWHKLMTADFRINTSIPDTGRWDASAWRKASKKGVAK